jgi:hypothetical protein
MATHGVSVCNATFTSPCPLSVYCILYVQLGLATLSRPATLLHVNRLFLSLVPTRLCAVLFFSLFASTFFSCLFIFFIWIRDCMLS